MGPRVKAYPCACGDCLSCELRDMRSRTTARRRSTRLARARAERVRVRHRRALAAGATPEQIVDGRAA